MIVPPGTFMRNVPSSLAVTVIRPFPKSSRIIEMDYVSFSTRCPLLGSSKSTSFRFLANKVGRPVPITPSIRLGLPTCVAFHLFFDVLSVLLLIGPNVRHKARRLFAVALNALVSR